MAEVLRLESVHYSYPLASRSEREALSGINLEIEPGEVLCIVGPNGSGKSTLSLILAALLEPVSGKMIFGKKEVKGRQERKEFRNRTGMLFQSSEEQIFSDTIFEDIAFGLKKRGLSGAALERKVYQAALMVGLSHHEIKKKSPFSLSNGEKRRVALAGILSPEPEILILDEPFTGLDHEGQRLIIESLMKYHTEKKSSVVIVSHDLSRAWEFANSFALLESGRIIKKYSKEEFVESSTEISSFGVMVPDICILARELAQMGAEVDMPLNAASLARTIAKLK
ncbi:MAG: ATP-binding cassette domain-containing protein [Actinomycetota bacterium]|nr:ATP-binding cassette domain-containing protein [Actinomycetota bacterium]